MKRAIPGLLAVFAVFSMSAAHGADITEPTEVGSTTMPPGEYTMVHNGSSKAYTLMVTAKGMMIMSPGKSDLAVTKPAAAVTAAPAAAVAPAAAGPTTSAAPASGASSLLGNDLVKGLVQKGMKEGMGQLGKMGGQGQINKLLK
jgi:hypothetical protein